MNDTFGNMDNTTNLKNQNALAAQLRMAVDAHAFPQIDSIKLVNRSLHMAGKEKQHFSCVDILHDRLQTYPKGRIQTLTMRSSVVHDEEDSDQEMGLTYEEEEDEEEEEDNDEDNEGDEEAEEEGDEEEEEEEEEDDDLLPDADSNSSETENTVCKGEKELGSSQYNGITFMGNMKEDAMVMPDGTELFSSHVESYKILEGLIEGSWFTTTTWLRFPLSVLDATKDELAGVRCVDPLTMTTKETTLFAKADALCPTDRLSTAYHNIRSDLASLRTAAPTLHDSIEEKHDGIKITSFEDFYQ